MGHRHGLRRTRTRLLAPARSRSLYLFDPEDRRWRRPWAEMLPAGYTEVEIAGGAFHTLAPAARGTGTGSPGPGGESRARDGVVIIHASQLPAQKQQETLFHSAAAADLHLILISGGHQEVHPLAEHIHRRQTPVRMREMDAAFRNCFARFWQHLNQTGQMRFELLEPERGVLAVLALLCQGYLLAHVESGTTSVTLPGADAESNQQATEAMARLGLGPDFAGSASSTKRQEQVTDSTWWSPLDLESLGETLATSDLDRSAAGTLADALAAGKAVDGSVVLKTYLALETHLRG